MAKFSGIVGFALAAVEVKPGVWDDQIIEKHYYGDVVRNSRRLDEAEKVNLDLSVGVSVSIVKDPFADGHFFAIRFLEWSGVAWTVTDVDPSDRPRLLLRLGGVYNGARATPLGTA